MSVHVRPDYSAEFSRLVEQLEECRDALQTDDAPTTSEAVTDGVLAETAIDPRQLIARDAARIMAALNALRRKVPPQEVRAYYEATVGYAKALARHTNNQDYVDRTIRAAEDGLHALDEWERKHGRGLSR